jgi:transposase
MSQPQQLKGGDEMKLYGAIDLHSTNNLMVVIDEQDQVVYQKRLPNDLVMIVEQLSPYRSSLEGIVVESTYNWYWLVDGLMEHGYRVHLANTAAIQQYEGLKYTDDNSDARLVGAHAAVGSATPGLYLPETTTAYKGSVAQEKPTGAPADHQPTEHSESTDAQHRIIDEC